MRHLSDQARLSFLTERERAVLALMMEGLSPAEIAERQFIARTTVRSHIRSILMKLGVRSQLAAVAMAYRVRSDAA